MFSLKHKLPILIMGAFAIMAFLSTSYFYEYAVEHIRRATGDPSAGLFHPMHLFVMAIYVTPVLLGWLYLMFWKDQLKPRFHYFWTSFGLFMIAWMLFVHLPFSMARDGKGIERILTESDTFFWGLGFGILYAFYSLRSAKPLWYFMAPMTMLGIFATLNGVAEFFGMPENRTYAVSDLVVVGSMTVVTLFFLASGIRNFIKRRKKS